MCGGSALEFICGGWRDSPEEACEQRRESCVEEVDVECGLREQDAAGVEREAK
jgi:hypothetical protein